MKTIIFDETCAGWTKHDSLNLAFLENQKTYLNDLLTVRRYLYMNTVYECLGAKWDPTDKNICYLAEFGPINIEFEPIGKGRYLVKLS